MKKQYVRYILEVLFFVVLVAIDLGTKELVFDLFKNKSTSSLLANILLSI